MAAAHRHPCAHRRLGRIAAHATATATPTPTEAVSTRLRLRPLAPKGFGAVAELRVAEATGSPGVRQALREALDERAVLCLRFGVDLDEGTMREVMEVFGPIKDRVGRCRDGVVRPYTAGQPGSRVDEELKVLDSSRALDGSGGGPSNWQCVAPTTPTAHPPHTTHTAPNPDGAVANSTDDSYCERPCAYTALHPRELPASGGGGTHFLNMRHAFEALPPARQRELEGLRGIHWQSNTTTASALFGRGAPGPDDPKSFAATNLVDVSHPLVRTHPRTGAKALYINLDRMNGVEGMRLEEAGPMLSSLEHFAEQSGTIYCHKWQHGDFVIVSAATVCHHATV